MRSLLCVLLAIVSFALTACDAEPHSAAAPDPTSAELSSRAAPLPAEGPYIRITSPTLNTTINLDEDSATLITLEYDFLPHPDDTTGGILVIYDDQPAYTHANTEDPVQLMAEKGMHSATLIVTDDAGVARDGRNTTTTINFKVSVPCMVDADCVDANPCSAEFCLIVGYDFRCAYGLDPMHTLCCQNQFDCDPGELCLDIYPLGGPDEFGDCVECDGSPDNCPHVPCMIASCHDQNYTCQYEPNPDCCVPGGDPCPLDPCETCLSEDGVEGVCGPAGPPGECCLTTDAAAGAPDYGCNVEDPCAVSVCHGNACRFDTVYNGCCTEDTDCTDPLELNVCTGEFGVCEDIAGEPGTGFCAYPRVDDVCCVDDGDCQDRFPEEVGRCERPAPGEPGVCDYQPNPDFCTTEGPGLFITELMLSSDVGINGSWIEVFNSLGTEVDLNGWRFEDFELPTGVAYVLADPAPILAPGGHAVVARIYDPALTGGVVPDADSLYGVSLDAISGGLRLIDPTGAESDMVTWDARFPIEAGRTLARISPYAPSDDPASWRASVQNYGAGGSGTPGTSNLDVHEPEWTPPLCDDGRACTLDICHANLSRVCQHRQVPECCDGTSPKHCDDGDECTIDTCDVTSFTCEHVWDYGRCCKTSGDCPPAPPGMTLYEESRYSQCTLPLCVSGRCAYERNPLRPDCCISADHPDLGCRDGNVCTPDVCDDTAGTTEFGTPFPACVFERDVTGDGVPDCCDTDADCDDGDPTTAERCVMDGPSSSRHRCERGPDTDYCGPAAADQTCDDANPCTEDTCCAGEDDPIEACAAAERCVHTPIPDCCHVDAWCDDGDECTEDRCCAGEGDPVPECEAAGDCAHLVIADCCHNAAECEERKPVEETCQTGYCIHGHCIYGYPTTYPGCCVEDADCDDGDRCTLESCVDGVCQQDGTINPPRCCHDETECPRSDDPCLAWSCQEQECVALDVPGCCSYADQGLSEPCNDDNPCTADLCHDGRCWHTPVAIEGCCQDADDCIDSGAPCTQSVCRDDTHQCRAQVTPDCRLAPPLDETFWVNAVYGDQLSFALLSWTVTDGAGAVLEGDAAADWQLASGRDQDELAINPGKVALWVASQTEGERCLVTPPIDLTNVDAATLQWEDALAGDLGDARLEVRVGSGPNPSLYTTLWTADADAASEDASSDAPWRTVDVPWAALHGADSHVAFCASGGEPGLSWAVDRIVLAAGTPPEWLSVPDTTIVVYSDNRREVVTTLRDLGPTPANAPAHTPGTPPIRVMGSVGPPALHVLAPQTAEDGETQVQPLLFLPTDLSIVNHREIDLVATDGALRSKTTITVEFRSAFCTVDSDCDDGDPCTTATCRSDNRCVIRALTNCSR